MAQRPTMQDTIAAGASRLRVVGQSIPLFPPSGIRTKMASAQRHDKPRWGDFPEKMELPYIRELVRTGGWFDGEHPFLAVDQGSVDEDVYAPSYFREHSERFRYLIERP